MNSLTEIKSTPKTDCYLCGSKGKYLYERLQDRIFNAPGKWNLKKCSNPECELIWLDPMPLPTEISKAYSMYYTHGELPSRSQLWYLLRKVYRGVKLTRSRFLGNTSDELQRNNMYLPSDVGRLLEIGCGSGYFLFQMQQKGWDVEGIDLDPKAAETADKWFRIKVKTALLHEANYVDNSFNAIVMSHVIEHIPDPIETLKECYRLLKPGGYCIAVTPNSNSWGHNKFKSDWIDLDPPRHMHIFSKRSIESAAYHAGFKHVKTLTTSVNSVGSLTGSLILKRLGHFPNMKVKKIDLLQGLIMQTYYQLFEKNSYEGEEIALILKKDEGL